MSVAIASHESFQLRYEGRPLVKRLVRAPYKSRTPLNWVLIWSTAALLSVGGSVSIVAAAILIH